MLGAMAAGCSEIQPEAFSSGCGPGVAQLLIMDGMAKRLCGCQAEPDDTLVVPPAALDCTVAAGTQVFFRFEGAFNSHQVVFPATGQTGLSGHTTQPLDPASLRPHVVLLEASGTYVFRDGFNTAVQGSIIVP